MTNVSTQHIDYLQRNESFREPESAGTEGQIPKRARRLWHVDSIGFAHKGAPPVAEAGAGGDHQLVTKDAIIGLYGHQVPLAFVVWGESQGVDIHVGSWDSSERSGDPLQQFSHGKRAPSLGEASDLVRTVLTSLYPDVSLKDAPEVGITPSPRAGIVLGTPTVKPPDPSDHGLAWDRIFRSMLGSNWAVVVLAEPISGHEIVHRRDAITEELRRVKAVGVAEKTPKPLADQYASLLSSELSDLSKGLATGMWRTAVYLLGDEDSYPRLASVWQAVYSGDESVVEPIRVTEFTQAGDLAANWTMIDETGRAGPEGTRVERPYEYQSLLTSRQLSAYVHLPNLETLGFAVNEVPDFDVERPSETGDINIGNVLLGRRRTDSIYSLPPSKLTRHAFVAGMTGSGKTNTVHHLLKQVDAAEAPFLVIEPVKTEYRELLEDPDISDSLRVYTLGDERVSPFRLNPFEVPEGTSVGVHIDLLRSVFSVSFGMWTPLPQVLERCLHEIYQDRGWDIATGTNRRLEPGTYSSEAFPTLTDLYQKVDEVVAELGYEQRVSDDLRSALRTRINSLRTGGKGRMLDVQHSVPMGELLSHPTVLELEGIGDDDDRAFLMGILLVRLAEHRRNERREAGPGGLKKGLRHLLVIEEAHRLLANVGLRAREEEANPRAKAVESFVNLLSEIRAYGQGVLVADQVPVKLAPDVIKNTNLKIVHRLVARDDRETIAGSMAMTESQAGALSILHVGEAVVFSEGDDAPILVQVPRVPSVGKSDAVRSGTVAEQMASMREPDDPRFTRHRGCAAVEPADFPACDVATAVADDWRLQREVGRIALSVLTDIEALDRLTPGFRRMIDGAAPSRIDRDVFMQCLVARAAEQYAERRGVQAGWTFGQTVAYGDALAAVLSAGLETANEDDIDTFLREESAVEAFRDLTEEFYTEICPPCVRCDDVAETAGLCVYRHAVDELYGRGVFTAQWTAAFEQERLEGGEFPQTWRVCFDATQHLLDFTPVLAEAIRFTALCYGQTALAHDSRLLPETRAVVMEDLIARADAWETRVRSREGDGESTPDVDVRTASDEEDDR